MSKSARFAYDWLRLEFQNVGIDSLGILSTEFPGDLYVSLHSEDPGVGGDQSTGEATYGGYARFAVARSEAGWTVMDANGDVPAQAQNAAGLDFPVCDGAGQALTHFGIGTAASGKGKLNRSGKLIERLVVGHNVFPRIEAGWITVRET